MIVWQGVLCFHDIHRIPKQCKDAVADGKFNDQVQLLINATGSIYKLYIGTDTIPCTGFEESSHTLVSLCDILSQSQALYGQPFLQEHAMILLELKAHAPVEQEQQYGVSIFHS